MFEIYNLSLNSEASILFPFDSSMNATCFNNIFETFMKLFIFVDSPSETMPTQMFNLSESLSQI